MKNIKGFTLAEVMITMGVLAVLAAMLIPAAVQMGPDTTGVMLKKAYSTAEKTVSSLISSDLYYPVTPATETTDTHVSIAPGFHNQALGTFVPVNNDKFCYLFSDLINTVTSNCTPNDQLGPPAVPKYTMTTTDGIVWTFTPSTFDLNATAYKTAEVLAVDINGSKLNGGKGPDCFYNATTCRKPDKFRFRIRYDGKMTVDSNDEYAMRILTNPLENRKQ